MLSYLLVVSTSSRAGIGQSVQRLATGWTVRWSNPGMGEIFRTHPDRPWCPPSLLYNEYRVFPGGKAAGAWRWPPTPSSAEVKERVEPYLYASSGPSWLFLGWALPLPHLFAFSSPTCVWLSYKSGCCPFNFALPKLLSLFDWRRQIES